jgi:hypothetical protein
VRLALKLDSKKEEEEEEEEGGGIYVMKLFFFLRTKRVSQTNSLNIAHGFRHI